MAKYTYTIFDANPNTSSGTAWPTHERLELEADSDRDAESIMREIMRAEASAGACRPGYGYEVGQKLYALAWNEYEICVGEATYMLTSEDLGVAKSSVAERQWEAVSSYVATFPADGGENACDVEVQIGEAAGVWFVRTRDDAGGSDNAPDTEYETRDAAEKAAVAFAEEANEAEDGEGAEDYLRRKKEERRGEPDPDGEWCVYWTTTNDDEGPRARYASEEQAVAAVDLANDELHARHHGQLLCGFEVRRLVDGEWIEANPDRA